MLCWQGNGRPNPEVVGSIPTEVKIIFPLSRVVPWFPSLGLTPSGSFVGFTEHFNLHFRVNSLFHHLCLWCYAAQPSYVPLFLQDNLRRRLKRLYNVVRPLLGGSCRCCTSIQNLPSIQTYLHMHDKWDGDASNDIAENHQVETELTGPLPDAWRKMKRKRKQREEPNKRKTLTKENSWTENRFKNNRERFVSNDKHYSLDLKRDSRSGCRSPSDQLKQRTVFLRTSLALTVILYKVLGWFRLLDKKGVIVFPKKPLI